MADTNYIIDVEHLSKNFGDLRAVIDVGLRVKRGEVFGFLGPNGSGKTTTIRMLCGLLIPDKGEGHCLGFDIRTQSLKIKEHVGYMTQRFSYYEDLSIEENLDFIARVYGIENSKRKIRETLENFGLAARRKQLAGSLSGGWKQRLALAASLLHEPELLLLDEPTAGVDPKARREFWDEIHSLSVKGVTTLVSTHYMDEAERCTRLAYISNGRLLVEGKLHEVVDKVGLTTYLVKGSELVLLSEKLKTIKEIEQVVMYGEYLHVSAKDKDKLLKAIQPLITDKRYEWQEIPSGLEDAFIYLTRGE